VGDDDSGPEDVEDDLDLECETVKTFTSLFVFALQEPAKKACGSQVFLCVDHIGKPQSFYEHD
jgi:hypothetical protein